MPTDVHGQTRSERRLAAILAADIAGWSRLMGRDEEGTLAALKRLRHEVLDPCIAEHRGRIVKTTGDGLLIEFPSVVDALHCAILVQGAMKERNREVPSAERIEFRVGINLGDVIIDGHDVYGDGVNIAARLETLAEPGGICVSQTVHDHARGKIAFSAEDAGEQLLKNINRPVRVWRITSEPTRSSVPQLGPTARKPTIAVLPLTNMSGDPEQEFFADGLTEDILTELSRFHELFVISRSSVFVYKGKAVNVQRVAKELGVQYVVEGSVRKSGNRVRVTVQLIEAEGDHHLWAERYDRELKDIFAIQDEITIAIAAVLPGRVEAAARERVKRKTPDNLLAWELVLAGKLLHHRSRREDNEQALQLLERAIALDPAYAHAHAWKACTLGQRYVNGWCTDVAATLTSLLEAEHIAQGLDDNDSDVHRLLAATSLVAYHDHERALHHQARALALNPNDDLIVVQQGELLTWIGQAEEGIEWIRKAMRLNPYHPERFWSHLGRAYFVARRYADAVEAFNHIARPDHSLLAFLAACHAAIGDMTRAEAIRGAVLAQSAGFSASTHLMMQYYRRDEDRGHHRDMLLRAGFPESTSS